MFDSTVAFNKYVSFQWTEFKRKNIFLVIVDIIGKQDDTVTERFFDPMGLQVIDIETDNFVPESTSVERNFIVDSSKNLRAVKNL